MEKKAHKDPIASLLKKVLNEANAGENEKARTYILEGNPEEKKLIGGFDKKITFKDIARRMLLGEDFYQMTKCEDSVHREICFRRLSAIYATDYDTWYYCWLSNGRAISRAGYAKLQEAK